MKLLENWKQSVIVAAVDRHKMTLPAVLEMQDASYLDAYDQLLGMLTGPLTIQVRRRPRVLDVLRIRGSQRAFEKAVHHARQAERFKH
ncbi:TPA: hypothetical protein ACP32N_003214 [Pseudomonas aeruginosa]